MRPAWMFAVAFCLLCLGGRAASAQDKGDPGKFDFYLLNIAAPADFCHVPGAGAGCVAPNAFALHGLWTQKNNGTYPVNCSSEHGPEHLERFFDLTPDLPLLQHEWDKHGTCTALGPERFFAMERQAYGLLFIPRWINQPERTQTLETDEVLRELYRVNAGSPPGTGFPAGSILLSCRQGKLTAIEACFNKDLQPIACVRLPSCAEKTVTLEPPPPRRPGPVTP